MRDQLAKHLSLPFLDRLNEYTQAKARHAWNGAREITPHADQRLVGHARQDAHQDAFKAAATACNLEVVDFRPFKGNPSRYVLDCGEFNLIALKNNATRTAIDLECKALALLADERLSVGAEIVDFFTQKRIVETNKPLYAWTAVWTGAKSMRSALPTWVGFCELEATGQRHVRTNGTGIDFQDIRAAVVDNSGESEKRTAKQKFTPRAYPSEEVKGDE